MWIDKYKLVVIKNKLSVLVLYCTGYVELAQWIEGWPKKRAFPWLMAKTFVRPRTSGEMDGVLHKTAEGLHMYGSLSMYTGGGNVWVDI